MDKTKIAVDIFNKHAEGYQTKFMDVNSYSEGFDIFLKHIEKQNAEVLELACGPGNITNYLLNKRPDLKILGTDLAPNMIALAKTNNPTAAFQLLDCRDILKLQKKYDALMCGFCLPYLSKEDAVNLIADASKILNDKGVIYISTMEDDHSKSGFKKGSQGDEIFMHYHEGSYLQKALEENNLKIIEIKRQDFSSDDGTKFTDLIIVAKK